MLLPLLVFLLSFAIALITVPRVILLAEQKSLFDEPKEKRKQHKQGITNLGGVAIFLGIALTQTLFINSDQLPNQILLAAAIILFMLGLKDDLIGMHPFKKLLTQIGVAIIIAYWGDIRFVDLQGLLNIQTLPYAISISLTTLFIVGLINAINLIDGIDGLAASQGAIISFVFAMLFYFAGENSWGAIAMAVCGSLLGFLYYNVNPAKIFMGDSGSLLIGLYVSVFAIVFSNVSASSKFQIFQVKIQSGLGIAAALIMIPVFDTLRVLTLRMLKNSSPFTADRTHLHHRLLSLGLSHTLACITLGAITFFFLFIALYFQDLGNTILVIGLFTLMLCINLVLFFLERKLNNPPVLSNEM